MMGSTQRRERQRQELRLKILDAARELFSDCGYEAVTMRRIAEKIEYSPTTIYLHFRDKDALLRELCTLDFLELASRFQASHGKGDPLQRLRCMGFAFIRFAMERPHHYRLMFMTPHPPVAIDERGIEKGNPQVDAWAFLRISIAEAQQAGLLDRSHGNADMVAQLFFAALHGIAALHIAKANDPWIDWQPVHEIAARMIDTLSRGFGPAAAPAAAPSSRDRAHHSAAGMQAGLCNGVSEQKRKQKGK